MTLCDMTGKNKCVCSVSVDHFEEVLSIFIFSYYFGSFSCILFPVLKMRRKRKLSYKLKFYKLWNLLSHQVFVFPIRKNMKYCM